MAEIRYVEEIEIAAPIDAVYDYRLDFTNLPAYNPNVSNLRQIETDAIAEYRFDLTLPGMTEGIESPLRVVKADRPHIFEYDTGPGFMAHGDCTFSETQNGTKIALGYTLTFEGEIDDATRAALESSGREQSRLELENIRKVFEQR